MDRFIRLKLGNMNISDLKATLEICEEKGRTSLSWKERADWVREVLETKIGYLFD